MDQILRFKTGDGSVRHTLVVQEDIKALLFGVRLEILEGDYLLVSFLRHCEWWCES